MDWAEIDSRPSAAQRRALYRWGISRDLVQHLTATEAQVMLTILIVAGQRAAVAQAEQDQDHGRVTVRQAHQTAEQEIWPVG